MIFHARKWGNIKMRLPPLSGYKTPQELSNSGYEHQHTFKTGCARKVFKTYVKNNVWNIVVEWQGVVCFIFQCNLKQMQQYLNAPEHQSLELIHCEGL